MSTSKGPAAHNTSCFEHTFIQLLKIDDFYFQLVMYIMENIP